MDILLADIRYALRQFTQRPLFTAAVVVTLALGIGGNIAIFTVADQVMLQPLPYAAPERLVRIYTQFPELGSDRFGVSAPEYLELAEWSESFAAIGAWKTGASSVSGGTEPVRVADASASASFFEALGVHPARGRWISAADDTPAAEPAVVLGHGLWQRAFGSDESLVGATVTVNGFRCTVVGIAPPGFDVADSGIQVWLPLRIDRSDPGGRSSHDLNLVGRLAPGTTLAAARQETDALLARWEESFPDAHHPSPDGHPLAFQPLHDDVVGQARTPLLLLLGAVGFVLLIACANVANLMLVRAEGRQREIAVRASLGAARWHLVRQFLTESVLLATAGALVGLGLASAGLQAVMAANPHAVPRASEIGLDSRALLFTTVTALVTGLLFGLAPALRARARAGNLVDTLKDGGRSTGGATGQSLRHGLVVVEVAMATLLVLGAGLLMRSFWNLQQVDPGFDAGGVLSFQISPPRSHYPEAEDVRGFYQRLLGELSAVPGVESAAALSHRPPVRPANAANTEFEGVETGPARPANVDYLQIVEGDAFGTLGIPLVAGRGFRDTDTSASPPAVVVNEALAERFYPGENPLGKRLRRGWWSEEAEEPWYTIVGVAADVKQDGLDRPAGTELYFLHSQWDSVAGVKPPRALYLVVRTSSDPLALVPAVRDTVHRLDSSLPLADLQPLERVVADSLTRSRFLTLLVGVFAALALLLAAVGTYGVLAYAVSERKHELGIRMALGATAREIRHLVVGQGMRPVLAGLALGLAGALLVGRALASQLYGIAPTDPLTYTVVPVVLVGVAMAACLLPARIAARVDPAVALRSD